MNLTISPTFAFPKKAVDQCDVNWDGRHGELQARVAQLVEQLICNQLVGGSSPFSGSWEAMIASGILEEFGSSGNVQKKPGK